MTDWTDHNVHDPGITLLELLEYAIDLLSYCQDQLAHQGYVRRRRLLVVLGVASVIAFVRCKGNTQAG